jgi:YegS/Rv2252/BmrU family lipid kinase
MNVVVLLNERSGSCATRESHRLVDDVREAFRAAGVAADVRCVAGENLATEARAAAAAGADAVVAGGGDGTISAVAAALAGGATPLGVFPLGTLNHFAKDLGIPADLAAAARIIAAGQARQVDLGRVNDRPFINNSSLGVYSRAVIEREQTRHRLGLSKWAAMLWAALKTLWIAPMMHVRLEVAGETIRLKTPLVFVGNNRYRLELPQVGARDRLDEGVLSLYVATADSRWRMLKLLARAAAGKLRASRDLKAMYAADVWIETRRSRPHVALDGEIQRLPGPLHYEIWPGALHVLTKSVGGSG